MLEQTIAEIHAAEVEAANIVAKSLAEAREMNVQAEKDAENIRLDAVAKVKIDRRRVVEQSEADAEEKYDEIVALGKKAADDLIRNTKIDKAKAYIAEKVLNRYVNR